MDPLHKYDDIPWELVEPALRGELSPADDARLQEWLGASDENRRVYERLQELWKTGLADYPAYRDADADRAWMHLHEKMGREGPGTERSAPQSIGARRFTLSRYLVAAAVVVMVVGGGWWFLEKKNAGVVYRTTRGERRNLSLPDGSTVELDPQTSLTVAPGYENGSRTIVLASGKARFEVVNRERRPFRVEMGVAAVEDIGTHFTVERNADSIVVSVSAGKVAFISKSSKERRLLIAGNSLVFYPAKDHFGDVQMRFYDVPLREVLDALGQRSGKAIVAGEGVGLENRLTIDLGGESTEDALRIICASLDLDYADSNGGYLLKPKTRAANHPLK
ncbi:FecR family protein [Puia sp.]|jgi:transmembrane sensor|uniref:FecR family protein n=1 Tax=Puia sp. TaxID=2045100 RepID=UPI002F3EF19A